VTQLEAFAHKCLHYFLGARHVQHTESKHDFKLDETFPTWRGWHAARRGLGTNLYALGVPEKVIQEILRHANVATTSTYYIKTIPAQVSDAMERLQQALPEALSGNEVATKTTNTTASSAVN
jgi:integrase